MKPILNSLCVAVLICSCVKPSQEVSAIATDSIATPVSIVEETAENAGSDSISQNNETSEAEDVYGEVGEDFQGDYEEGNELSRNDENGTVHFATSHDVEGQTFPVSMFAENNDAVADVPAYLKSKGIQYKLEKIEGSSDPADYESTDSYTYTFGESVIEILYSSVSSAVIYSPEIELKDGVKVGMTKEDFIALFPQLQEYADANEFTLHPYPFAEFCFMTFSFKDGKMTSIKLELGLQDCG
jgi:hypothetical protein